MENHTPRLENDNDYQENRITTDNQNQNNISHQEQNQTSSQVCMNCINMAKNFLYVEGLLKSNRRPCNGCQAGIKFLTYLNKNIAYVFNNLNYPQYYVVQEKRQIPTNKRKIPKRQPNELNNINNNNFNNRTLPKNASKSRNVNITSLNSNPIENNHYYSSTKYQQETKLPQKSISRMKHSVTKPTISSLQKSSMKTTTTATPSDSKGNSSKNFNSNSYQLRKSSEKKVTQKKRSPKIPQTYNEELTICT